MNQEQRTKNNEPVSTDAVFDAYAASYDLLYRDKDYAGEADYIDRLIRKFQPDAKSIVELGSGTGKHARLLANKGYTVHGIERSEEMLARAREETVDHRPVLRSEDGATQGKPKTIDLKKDQVEKPKSTVYGLQSTVSFSLGDVRTARLGKTFDAAISLFHVASYQTTNEDLKAYFETVRVHLKPDGIFIFDFWYGPAVFNLQPRMRVKHVEDAFVKITRLAEPAWHIHQNQVDVKYHLFVRSKTSGNVAEIHELHSMRYFFLPELEAILAHNGLELIAAEEWLSGEKVTDSSWGVCVVAKAIS